MDDIAGAVNINKPYKLEFVFPGKLETLGITTPINNTTYQFDVIMESGVAVFSLGGITTLDLRFKVNYGE